MMKILAENWYLFYGWFMYVAGLFMGALIVERNEKNDCKRNEKNSI